MATPNIVPRADSEGGIGTASKYWASAYIDLIYVGAGKMGRDADNLLDFSTDNQIKIRVNGTNEIFMNNARFAPSTNDGYILGGASNQWSDLFLASGAVINFDNGNVTLTHSSGQLLMPDNHKLRFGDSGDLTLYHNTDSYIDKGGAGNLIFQQNVVDSDIIFKADNGSGTATAYLTLDGSATITQAHKNLRFDDNAQLQLGVGSDLRLYHTGSTSFVMNYVGDVRFINYQDDGDFKFETDDGSGGTTEYFRIDGGNEQIEIGKNMRFADNVIAKFGTGGDLQIKHNATASSIENYVGDLTILNTSQDNDIVFKGDDGQANTAVATYFYLDGSSATHDGSATTALYTNWPDKSRISLGTGHDLYMYHDGSNTYFENEVGNLTIFNKQDDGDIILASDNGASGTTAYLTLDGGNTRTNVHKDLRFDDNIGTVFGSGAALKLHSDGSNGLIDNFQGSLLIRQQVDDADIVFQSDDGSGGVTTYLTLDGGEVRTKVHKDFRADDNVKIQAGTGGDLDIYHTGSNATIDNATGDFIIQSSTDNGDITFKASTGTDAPAEYFKLDGGVGYMIASKAIRALDSVNLQLGASADLTLQHNGTDSQVTNSTGNLQFTNTADDGDIILQSDDGSGGTTTYFSLDGSLADGTYTYTKWPDNSIIALGSSNDLVLWHDGSNSYIRQVGTGDLIIENITDDKDIIFKSDNGSGGTTEYFRLDGANAQTEFERNAKFLDNIKLMVGTGEDLQMYHDSSHTHIVNYAGNLRIRQFADDSDITLESDDGSGGTTAYFRVDGGITKTVFVRDTKHEDSKKALFGDQDDLQIYHDGSNSYISDQGTGSLQILTSKLAVSNAAGTEALLNATQDGAVNLYYNGVGPKLATASDGVTVTGSLTPSLGVTKPIASAAANVAAAVAGSIYTFSDTDGAVVTLPDSGGGGLVGQTFEFVCTATVTSNSHKVIFSDTTNEKFIGRLTAIDTDTDNTQLVYVPVTANKAIVMNGTTTGITGSRFTITNVAADVWMIEGYVHHTGNTANPFANS